MYASVDMQYSTLSHWRLEDDQLAGRWVGDERGCDGRRVGCRHARL
jgi:hypothetical protein